MIYRQRRNAEATTRLPPAAATDAKDCRREIWGSESLFQPCGSFAASAALRV